MPEERGASTPGRTTKQDQSLLCPQRIDWIDAKCLPCRSDSGDERDDRNARDEREDVHRSRYVHGDDGSEGEADHDRARRAQQQSCADDRDGPSEYQLHQVTRACAEGDSYADLGADLRTRARLER